jgi:hypothetical protein
MSSLSARASRLGPRLTSLLLGSLLLISLAPAAVGSEPDGNRGVRAVAPLPGRMVEYRAGRGSVPPRPVIAPTARAGTHATPAATANIVVDYNGFTPAAQAAFQVAVDIWEARIVSSQTIHVTADWTNLGSGILGSAGPDGFWLFDDGRVYPAALAETVCACALQPNEIIANFNSGFAGWYMGTDGNVPSDRWDFITVVLHELGHGLGFLSSYDVSGTQGYWGFTDGVDIYPTPYDINVWDGPSGTATRLTKQSVYPNPSAALKAQLTDGTVFFGGPNVVAVNGGKAKLYAPSPWEPGSSVSHFDETAFPPGTPNALMTPFLWNGEVLHQPGALTLALLRDIGWETAAPPDNAAPVVTPPNAAFRTNVKIFASSTPVPVRVSFTATDASAIASTQLARRIDGGAYTPVPLVSANAMSADVNFATSDTTVHQFKARATDASSNTSAYAAGAPFKVRVFQNGSPGVVEVGTWASQSSTSFYGGSVRHSTSSTAKQRLTISNATDFAVVSTMGPNRGKLKVFVDGVLQTTIDLYSASTVYRQVVYQKSFASAGSHTIEVRPTNTKQQASTGTRADLDAFLVMTP